MRRIKAINSLSVGSRPPGFVLESQHQKAFMKFLCHERTVLGCTITMMSCHFENNLENKMKYQRSMGLVRI